MLHTPKNRLLQDLRAGQYFAFRSDTKKPKWDSLSSKIADLTRQAKTNLKKPRHGKKKAPERMENAAAAKPCAAA
jgi:hypothetical protein